MNVKEVLRELNKMGDPEVKKIKLINKDYNDGNSIHWGISTNEYNKIIGTCGYYRGFKNGVGEIGFILNTEFYGRGFMNEAIKIALDYGLKNIGLNKVIAITANTNLRAIGMLERLNFKQVSHHGGGKTEYAFIG